MKYSVSEITLTTGTKGLFVNVPNSEVVQVKIFFRGGFQFGDFAKFELPHVLEHLILSSSKSYPGNNQLRSEFTKNGAQYNAHTTKDLLVYWLQAADIDFERAFKLFVLGLTEPLLPEESLKAEIGNVSSELTAMLSQNASYPSLMSYAANYPKHYIPTRERIDQLPSITMAEIEEYLRKTHTASNGGFIVAGAVNKFSDLVREQLEVLFSQLPQGSLLEFDQSPGLGQAKPLVHEAPTEAEFFRLEWFTDGGDMKESAVYDVISTILTRGFDSRVFGRVRNTGASYSTMSGFDHSLSATHFIFGGQANPDRLAEVEGVIAEECSRLMSERIEPSVIEQAVMRIEGGVKVATQTPASVGSWYQDEYIFNHHIQSHDDYFAILRTVEPQDIIEASTKIFMSARHSSAYSGPMTKAQLKKTEIQLRPIWN